MKLSLSSNRSAHAVYSEGPDSPYTTPQPGVHMQLRVYSGKDGKDEGLVRHGALEAAIDYLVVTAQLAHIDVPPEERENLPHDKLDDLDELEARLSEVTARMALYWLEGQFTEERLGDTAFLEGIAQWVTYGRTFEKVITLPSQCIRAMAKGFDNTVEL